MDQNFKKQIRNSIKKRRLVLGGKMVLDPDFDIKNYLTDVQKQIELEKINFNARNSFLPPINSHRINYEKKLNNFNTINYNIDNDISKNGNKVIIKSNSNIKKPFLSLNNLLSISEDPNNYNDSKIKNSINIDLNIQKNLSDANHSIDATKNQIQKILKKEGYGTKSSKIIFRKNNNDLFITDKPGFNINKTIKEIKKREQSSLRRNNNIIENIKKCKSKDNYNYIYNRDNNLYNNDYQDNNIDNIINNVVAYDRSLENFVFEPVKVLNNYERRKYLQISPSENYLNMFINQNKQLSIDNILLKLMNSETNKLKVNHNMRSGRISTAKKLIETNEANFNEYQLEHRKICSRVDSLYANVKNQYKHLIREELINNSEIKTLLDEIKRMLQKIEHLRKYGKFVNRVLGGDNMIFEQKIISEQKFSSKIDVELLARNVIKQYKILLKEKYDIDDDRSVQENNLIDDPEKMWLKFREMENLIVTTLSTKEDLKREIKNIKEENDFNLLYLREKNESLQNEYKELKEKYDKEISKVKEIEKEYSGQNNEFNKLIKNIYIYINNNIIKKNIINDNKSIYNELFLSDYIKIIFETIYKFESDVENYIKILINLEKEDPKTFEKILNFRKKNLKEMKQLNLVNKKIKEMIKMTNDSELNKNMVLLYSRKTEAPYHKHKKVVEEEIDENIVKQQENEYLLNFE